MNKELIINDVNDELMNRRRRRMIMNVRYIE